MFVVVLVICGFFVGKCKLFLYYNRLGVYVLFLRDDVKVFYIFNVFLYFVLILNVIFICYVVRFVRILFVKLGKCDGLIGKIWCGVFVVV